MSKENIKGLVPKLRFPEFRDAGEWEKKPLGEIGKFIGGGTPATSVPEYWDGNIQWFTPTEIKQRNLSKSKRTITEEGLKKSAAKLLPSGTLLLSTRATVGDVGIADNPCTTNQGFQSLLVNDTEINVFWYYWILQHKFELIRRSSGSTFLEIGATEVRKVPSLRPDKKEQQKIADCLSSLDELIAAHSKKFEALQSYKKGLMQNLFPAEGKTIPKLRFPEFRDAGEWDAFKLKNKILKKVIDNRGKTPPLSDSGYPLVEVNALGSRSIDYTQVKKYVDEDTYQNWFRGHVCEGDILFSTVGAIAESSIVSDKDEPVIAQNIVGLRVDEGYSSEFVFYLLSATHNKKLFLRITMGAVQPSLKVSQMVELEFLVPENEEQQKIADCLTSVDELITAQAQKIEDLKAHKKGLMQQLFPATEGGG